MISPTIAVDTMERALLSVEGKEFYFSIYLIFNFAGYCAYKPYITISTSNSDL